MRLNPKIAPDSPWRTKQGIAERYGVCIRTVTEWMKKRILPYVKAGRVVMFNIHDCDKAIQALTRQSVLIK